MYKNIIKTIFNKNSNNSFILDKLYLTNKFNCSLRIEEFKIDNFDGFTVIYLVYLSYLQQFTNFKQIKSFYKYCRLSLNARLNQNINLLEFIYLTAFNKLLGGKLKSYDITWYAKKFLVSINSFFLKS